MPRHYQKRKKKRKDSSKIWKRIDVLPEEPKMYLPPSSLLYKTQINTIDVDIHPKDRISRLPDGVLVHIASFLSSTPNLSYLSVVSKTFWSLCSTWNFSEESFYSTKYRRVRLFSKNSGTQIKFLTFVHTIMSRQWHGNKKMDQFRLHMCSCPPLVRAYVDFWIEHALHFFGAKSLDISFADTDKPSYYLAQTVLSAKELQVLRFSGGVIKLPKGHEWPSLRELNLSRGTIFDWTLVDNLISICPLIEKLYLQSCPSRFERRIHLSGLTKLREVEVIDLLGVVTTIMIDAPTLTLFHHTGSGGNSLQRLNLKACKNLEELKLKPFCGTGTATTYILPCLQNVSLGMSEHPIDFRKLGGFLGNFASIKLLSLEIDPRDVPVNLQWLADSIICPPLLPNVKQLHLNIMAQSWKQEVAKREDHRHLLDGLFLICRPKLMLLNSKQYIQTNDFINVLCQTLQRVRRTECCKISQVKCWKHYLKGLEVKLIKSNGRSSILKTPVQSLARDQKMCFTFMW